MGYEYDSQVNRELARTAMDIYKKAHNIDQPINESTQNLNEEAIRENVNGLIMNYISDVIILAEAQMGREMTDIEINEASDELLRRIDSISDADKVAFINELSEAMAPTMTTDGGAAAAPSRTGGGRGTGLGTARPGAAAKPSVGMRPTAGSDTGGYDIQPGEEGFAQQFSSFADYLTNGFPIFGGAGLTYVLAAFGNDAGSGVGVAPAAGGGPAAAGLRRRR